MSKTKKRGTKLKEIITKKGTTMTRKKVVVQGNDHKEGDDQDQEGGSKAQGDDHKGGNDQDQKEGGRAQGLVSPRRRQIPQGRG
jgi:hypothetical protein